MNRKARILLIVLGFMATVLVLLAAFQNRAGSDVLDLPGPGDISMVDEVGIVQAQGSVSVRRSGRDWVFTPPEGALADPARVSAVLDLFTSGLQSDIHSDIGGAPAAFGLDPASAVRVTIYSSGRVLLDVEIGGVQTFTDRPPDTFVRLPGEQSVFRVSGRDLRAPFASGKYSLRSRRLFAFNTADVVGLEFFNPAAPDPRDRHVVLAVREGTRGIAGQEVMSRAWAVVEPAGVNPGRINVLAAQLAGLSVESWHDSLPAGVVIDENSAGVVVRLSDGRKVRAAVSAVADGVAWVVSDAGVAKLRNVEAAGLARTVADVRDPAVLSVAREDIGSVQVLAEGGGFAIIRRAGGFEVEGQPSIELDRAAVEAFLANLAGLTATRVVGAGAWSPSDPAIRQLRLTLAGGRSTSVRFGPAGQDGLVPATVEGDPDVFMLSQAVADGALPTLDSLRRRNILAGGPESLKSIAIVDREGRRNMLLPPAAPGQQWRLVGTDGSEMSTSAVSGLAGTVMSMSAHGFLPDVPAPSVKAERGRIDMTGRGFEVRLKISDDVRDGFVVCAVSDRKQFSGQAILIPITAIEAVMSVIESVSY